MAEETEQKAPVIQTMCQGLHQYYTRMGQGNRYLNDDGVGLFSAYCDEYGYDDTTILDEFADVEECVLCDFDEDFPLAPNQQSLVGEARKRAIFDILLRSKDDPDSLGEIPHLEQKDFDLVRKVDIEHVKRLYNKYCPVVFNKELGNDGGLITLLAFQHKHKRFDFLANLVDSYNRYRVQVDPGAYPIDWGNLHDNKHFTGVNRKLTVNVQGKDTNTAYRQFATMCIQSYGTRMVPQLMYINSTQRINDSLAEFVQYLQDAITFVSNLVKKGSTICPFQMDFCVAFKNTVATFSDSHTAVKENDDDDDDDDDDQAADASDQKEENDDKKDWVQDIQKKLEANKLKYSVAAQDSTERRRFGILFQKFFADHKISEHVNQHQHYLHNKRLIAFADRRKGAGKKDDVYMYEPPNDLYTRDIPTGDDFLPEWFISSSVTCILPSISYDADDVVGNKTSDETVRNAAGTNLGAATHAKGRVITLSFHVLSEDKIKLYLYWNGAIIRFFPTDIKVVLCEMFVASKANKKFIEDESGELDKLIKDMESKLVDKQFEEWLKWYPVPQSKRNN
eukprot:CAMPEP_0197023498 /NCGR_PEP_ID=MMETSP1384-20130603/4175_1 /TAXON_ID=29189 /ORGANISM="Ammonia sp." /LENGTH=563 /DNA_ID=CAMNT_0042451713 /DNA_START=35 /DNA_END=1726 /DNA_ORIENTATION=+